ncbi:hypothetical protein [Acinetobacter sp. 10FS3-1]|uniref:hypothetical protein n=1 Tax=Acinetobacter sp. 10FS3-1 TaxID=2563897 RepID=UPI0015D1D9F9|nr:hypothetical protein [Acinetobacter sp. 10FS3-1]
MAGYLAAVYVGNFSAVIPIPQQDLGRSFTQAGFSLALAQGGLLALGVRYLQRNCASNTV